MRAELHDAAATRLLEVRTVEVIAGRERSVTLSSVRCPLRGRGAAVEECADCGESEGIAQDSLGHGRLSCRAPPPEHAAAGERAHVAEVMGASAVALRPGVGRGVAAEALRRWGTPAAPVVDGEGRPIGVVAEVDLLRARRGAKVADVMVKVALSVPEDAPVTRAAALLAAHRADRVAVVAGDGVVVGVLTAVDVLAWLAGAAGPLGPGETFPLDGGSR